MTASALEGAFRLASSELGMCSAAWLFVREAAAVGGERAVEDLRAGLGRAFPVLDAVAGRVLEGGARPSVDPVAVVAACAGVERLVVVGLEADHLDALAAALPDVRLSLLRHEHDEVDWARVAANYPGAALVDLAGFQRESGRRSALVTFVYGALPERAFVHPVWLRAFGADVRTQFRVIVGWDVLGAPPAVYPRWLAETGAQDFSMLVGA